jgi:hypothetical protein
MVYVKGKDDADWKALISMNDSDEKSIDIKELEN